MNIRCPYFSSIKNEFSTQWLTHCSKISQLLEDTLRLKFQNCEHPTFRTNTYSIIIWNVWSSTILLTRTILINKAIRTADTFDKGYIYQVGLSQLPISFSKLGLCNYHMKKWLMVSKSNLAKVEREQLYPRLVVCLFILI